MGLSNNDVLRKIRYALNLKDSKMEEIFGLGGGNTSVNEVVYYLSKEDDPLYRECPDKTLEYFLDGLIIFRRGKKDTGFKTGKVLMPKEKTTD